MLSRLTGDEGDAIVEGVGKLLEVMLPQLQAPPVDAGDSAEPRGAGTAITPMFRETVRRLWQQHCTNEGPQIVDVLAHLLWQVRCQRRIAMLGYQQAAKHLFTYLTLRTPNRDGDGAREDDGDDKSIVDDITATLRLLSLIERQGSHAVTCGENYCLCLLYTSPSPRDGLLSRMPSSA